MEECKCSKWTLNISYTIHRWHKPRDVWPSPHSEWRRSHPDHSLVERQQAAKMTDTLYLQSVLCSNSTELILHPSGPVSNEVCLLFFYSPENPLKIIKTISFFTYLINNKNWDRETIQYQALFHYRSSERLILTELVYEGGRERGRIYSLSLQPPRSRLSGLSPSGTLAVLLLYCCPGCPSASGLGRPR